MKAPTLQVPEVTSSTLFLDTQTAFSLSPCSLSSSASSHMSSMALWTPTCPLRGSRCNIDNVSHLDQHLVEVHKAAHYFAKLSDDGKIEKIDITTLVPLNDELIRRVAILLTISDGAQFVWTIESRSRADGEMQVSALAQIIHGPQHLPHLTKLDGGKLSQSPRHQQQQQQQQQLQHHHHHHHHPPPLASTTTTSTTTTTTSKLLFSLSGHSSLPPSPPPHPPAASRIDTFPSPSSARRVITVPGEKMELGETSPSPMSATPSSATTATAAVGNDIGNNVEENNFQAHHSSSFSSSPRTSRSESVSSAGSNDSNNENNPPPPPPASHHQQHHQPFPSPTSPSPPIEESAPMRGGGHRRPDDIIRPQLPPLDNIGNNGSSLVERVEDPPPSSLFGVSVAVENYSDDDNDDDDDEPTLYRASISVGKKENDSENNNNSNNSNDYDDNDGNLNNNSKDFRFFLGGPGESNSPNSTSPISSPATATRKRTISSTGAFEWQAVLRTDRFPQSHERILSYGEGLMVLYPTHRTAFVQKRAISRKTGMMEDALELTLALNLEKLTR